MKPPPFMLGTTLLFWGWQTGLFWVGAGMAVLVELAAAVKTRWDFSDEDFARIWTLCSLLVIAMVLFAFANNEGINALGQLAQDPDPNAQRRVSLVGARTASNLLRWLPMAFFPFLLAQTYSTRTLIPLTAISHILQRRGKLAQRLGQRLPAGRGFNVGYPYFCMTLLAASFHPAEDNSYFWGFVLLLGWALWVLRSRRYPPVVWVGIILVAGVAGYFGQRGIAETQRYLEAFNARWIARLMRRSEDPFQSRTAIGSVGRIKNSNAVAIRLTPRSAGAVPAYLREASYRRYEQQTWFAGSSRDDFVPVNEVPATTTNAAYWPLLPDKLTAATVEIACYLDGVENGVPAGLLPLPSGSARLDRLPAFGLKLNSAGTVLAQGPGLVIFEARFGPGKTFDSPPGTNTRRASRLLEDTNAPPDRSPPPAPPRDSPRGDSGDQSRLRRYVDNEDLDVSPRETNAVAAVIAELQLHPNLPLAEVLVRVNSFFSDRFTYSLTQERQRLAEGETPLSRFLLTTRTGHCEYFATATVLILRQLGIPARYATGFAVSESSGEDYVVRFSDAHAWVLVWDAKRGVWSDYDTTPGIWRESDRQTSGPWRALADFWGRIKFELAKFRYGQSALRKYLLWIVVPGLALLLYQIISRRRQKSAPPRKPEEAWFTSRPGLDSDFYQLERQLAARGVLRAEGEPLTEWLRRVLELPGLAELSGPLEEALRLHYRLRFDPLGLNARDRAALQRETRRCLTLLAAGAPTATPEKIAT
jgi:hypothetical protein